jgi:hypothetical protein
MPSREYKGRKSLKLERNGWNLPTKKMTGSNNMISLSLMRRKMYMAALALGAVAMVTADVTPLLQVTPIDAFVFTGEIERKGPVAISGDNVYVAWQSNNTSSKNEEIMFRASTDGGATFSDKINLSNTTDADSTRAEIDSDADSVVVTWWETNQTSDTPVIRVSTDNGATFGPMLMLATNGTIGESAEEDE